VINARTCSRVRAGTGQDWRDRAGGRGSPATKRRARILEYMLGSRRRLFRGYIITRPPLMPIVAPLMKAAS
jgi:hypothetical protein